MHPFLDNEDYFCLTKREQVGERTWIRTGLMLMPCSAKVMRQGATLNSCSEIPIPVVVAPTVKGAFCT